ncbi:hypothetical protein I3760_03G173700 [Carya illinoinensis]|nr:hypothetical protein I3760_03G173700 [Carya illinoinensis]
MAGVPRGGGECELQLPVIFWMGRRRIGYVELVTAIQLVRYERQREGKNVSFSRVFHSR